MPEVIILIALALYPIVATQPIRFSRTELLIFSVFSGWCSEVFWKLDVYHWLKFNKHLIFKKRQKFILFPQVESLCTTPRNLLWNLPYSWLARRHIARIFATCVDCEKC